MHTTRFVPTLFAATLCAGFGLASQAQSTPPELFIQNAQTVGAGNTLQLFGLPTRTTEGKVAYWDVTVVMEGAPTSGKPRAAAVTAVPTAKLKRAEFVQGLYNSGSCQLTASPFNGRNQYDMMCGNQVLSWWTGPIAGHPYEADLRAAGLDTLTGSDEYAWGRGMNNTVSCQFPGMFFGARQVGDVLTLNSYGNDTTLDCQINFFRTPVTP